MIGFVPERYALIVTIGPAIDTNPFSKNSPSVGVYLLWYHFASTKPACIKPSHYAHDIENKASYNLLFLRQKHRNLKRINQRNGTVGEVKLTFYILNF